MIWYFACDNFMDKPIKTELTVIPASDKFKVTLWMQIKMMKKDNFQVAME
jgi:hypothetical protein